MNMAYKGFTRLTTSSGGSVLLKVPQGFLRRMNGTRQQEGRHLSELTVGQPHLVELQEKIEVV